MRARRLLHLLLLPAVLLEASGDQGASEATSQWGDADLDGTSPWQYEAAEPQPEDLLRRRLSAPYDEIGWRMEEEARRLQARGLQGVLPPIKVILTNAAFVPDTWIVKELQLYFGHCHENRKIPVNFATVYDSGTRMENSQDVGGLAFDDSLQTRYVAQCSTITGGCPAFDAFVGLDITDTDDWSASRGPNATFDTVRVKCIRLFQSEEPRYKANTVALQEVNLGGLDFVRNTVTIFENLAGGVWTRRPAYMNTLWRIKNLWPTMDRWGVAEIRFYSDVLCFDRVEGAVITSGTYRALQNGDVGATDGNYSSNWVAGCNTPSLNSSIRSIGCGVNEAWIGLDFGDIPQTVRCVRMYQAPPNPQLTVADPRHISGFALETWLGSWVELERFWDKDYYLVLPPELGPTLEVPYFGQGHGPGAWEDTRPPNRSAWRLSNDFYTRAAWQVHELEFYDNPNCTADELNPLQGEPISMQGAAGVNESILLFNGITSPDEWWESSCTRLPSLNESRPCDRNEAWFGLYFSHRFPNVQCFRLWQSRRIPHQATSIALDVWLGGEWTLHSEHRDMGGGGWNRRPSYPWSMWRIINHLPIPGQWTIKEVRAYRDPLCVRPVTLGTAIGNGFRLIGQSMGNAFDAAEVTKWGADCMECDDEYKWWIGNELPRDATDPEDGINFVQCIRLWQSERMDQQAPAMRVDVWEGGDWTISPLTGQGIIPGGGGGTWIRQPAASFTKWRLRSGNAEAGLWRLNDIELYSDTDCTQPLRVPGLTGGASVGISGYRRELTAVELGELADEYGGLYSEAGRALDQDVDSSVLMEHRPDLGMPAWFSLDSLSEKSWVRCVRLMQGPVAYEQSDTVHLDFWDDVARTWNQNDTEWATSGFSPVLTGLGGGSWQRRPAAENTMWRLENQDLIPEGWSVYEVELHFEPTCSNVGGYRGLEGQPIASGFVPTRQRFGPQHAFDGDLESPWVSQCGRLPDNILPHGVEMPPLGCQPREAWIGLDLGLRRWDVKCVRVFQVGYRHMQSERVAVARWDGVAWRDAWHMDGLGGSAWDQRPRGPNTMFRVVNKRKKEDLCLRQKSRVFNRAWGVTDLAFYSDDACEQQISGGAAISSGTIETFRRSPLDPPSYALEGALDMRNSTVWAANCRFGWQSYNQSRMDCQDDWVGIDLGNRAEEVRCFKVMQARLESSVCCDPAEEMELQRWNGSTWTEVTWRHDPPNGATHVPSRDLGAYFVKMGTCPLVSSNVPYAQTKLWEKRERRHSDRCIVPLTGAVMLLGEPYCIEHPECIEFIQPDGRCCPIDDGTNQHSRCCCSFLSIEPIFQDEGVGNVVRAEFKLEKAIVMLSDVLPTCALALAVTLFGSAVLFSPKAQKKALDWAWDDEGRCLRWKKIIVFALWPLLMWRTWLATGHGIVCLISVWFCLPGPKRTRPAFTHVHRVITFLALVTFLGGIGPWVTLGFLAGMAFLKLLVVMSVVVRWAKSPYNRNDERDMFLRQLVTETAIKKEGETASAATVTTELVGVVILGLVYFLKFVFDVLVIRATMISYGVIETIETERLVDMFEGVVAALKEPAMIIFDIVFWSTQIMSVLITTTIGIPKCEGTCVLLGAVGIVMVLVTVTQWLNLDLFGLFAASQQVVKVSRPECQRAFIQGGVMLSIAFQFGAVQCALVLFSRALSVANPFGSHLWMCEWNDVMAIYIGRVFLIFAGFFGGAAVFLCANGHFLGQDYITRPIAEFLEIDLSELDPDGAGEEGGMFRWDVMFACLPSIFGIWTDQWNVRAFLVEERSRVYAEQLNDPQVCVHCGKLHVKYTRIMRATGRQVSLSMQILPYGTLIGKAAEYFNDPPFFYWGDKLACMKPRLEREPLPDLGKNKFVLKSMLLVTDCLAFGIEVVVPILARVFSVGLYVTVMMGIFVVTADNLLTTGRMVITLGFWLAFAKAAAEGFLEALLSFLLGVLSDAINDVHAELNLDLAIPRTVAGQIVAGATIATLLGTCLGDILAPGESGVAGKRFFAVMMGGIGGYAFSLLTLFVNLFFEKPMPQTGDPPANNTGGTMVKIAFATVVGLSVMVFSLQVTDLRGGIVMMMVVTAVEALTLKLVFMQYRGPLPDNPLVLKGPSASWAVLSTERGLSGLLAVPYSAFFGVMISDMIGGPALERALLSLVVGMVCAVMLGLTVNRLLDHPPQLVGFFTGIFAMVLVSNWNTVMSVVAGAVVGATVGSLLEMRVVRARTKLQRHKWWEEDRLLLKRQNSRTFSKSFTRMLSEASSRGGSKSHPASRAGTKSAVPALENSSRAGSKTAPAALEGGSAAGSRAGSKLAPAQLEDKERADSKTSKVTTADSKAGEPPLAIADGSATTLTSSLRRAADPVGKVSSAPRVASKKAAHISFGAAEEVEIRPDSPQAKKAASKGRASKEPPPAAGREPAEEEGAAEDELGGTLRLPAPEEMALQVAGPPPDSNEILDGFNIDMEREMDMMPTHEAPQRFGGASGAGSARGKKSLQVRQDPSRRRDGLEADGFDLDGADGDEQAASGSSEAQPKRATRAAAAVIKPSLWKAVAKPPPRQRDALANDAAKARSQAAHSRRRDRPP